MSLRGYHLGLGFFIGLGPVLVRAQISLRVGHRFRIDSSLPVARAAAQKYL